MPVVLSLRHHSSDGYIMAFLTQANRIGLIAAFVFSWMIFSLSQIMRHTEMEIKQYARANLEY